MKTIRTTLILAICVFNSLIIEAKPSSWSGDSKGKFWNHWAFTLSGGFTSYYGDLSVYDDDFFGKIQNESKPAFGFLLSKYFTEEVAVSGQFIYGGLKSTYNEEVSFDTDFIEYNIQLRLDLLNLILRNNSTGIGVIAFGGVGHFMFQSEKQTMVEGTKRNYSHDTKSPEFVYFFGGGLDYVLSERFNVSIDAGVRQAQNDRIDIEVAEQDYDYYTFMNVGITYFFGRNFNNAKSSNLKRSGIRMAYR